MQQASETVTVNVPAYEFNGALLCAEQSRKCERCDYTITRFFSVKEIATGNLMTVGSECVKIMTGKTPAKHEADKKKAAKQAEIERRARIQREAMESFKARHAAEFQLLSDVTEFFSKNGVQNEFIESLNAQFVKFGTLTERQLAAVANYYSRDSWARYLPVKDTNGTGAMLARAQKHTVNNWERDFIQSIAGQFERYGKLSEKQMAILAKIATRGI